MKTTLSNPNPTLDPLGVLVGQWKIVGNHPFMPNMTLEGNVTFEWVEGGAYLRMFSKIDHPHFPTGVAIIASDSESRHMTMLYFDERRVSRNYNFSIEENEWKWWRDNSKFSQRFTVTISEDGNTMVSNGEMRKHGGEWQRDLNLNYFRVNKIIK